MEHVVNKYSLKKTCDVSLCATYGHHSPATTPTFSCIPAVVTVLGYKLAADLSQHAFLLVHAIPIHLFFK